jgi:hypothetical protein
MYLAFNYFAKLLFWCYHPNIEPQEWLYRWTPYNLEWSFRVKELLNKDSSKEIVTHLTHRRIIKKNHVNPTTQKRVTISKLTLKYLTLYIYMYICIILHKWNHNIHVGFIIVIFFNILVCLHTYTFYSNHRQTYVHIYEWSVVDACIFLKEFI